MEETYPHKEKIDRLIHCLVLAEIVLGLAVMVTIVAKKCDNTAQPTPTENVNVNDIREQHLQLKSLEDSVHYFEDGL